MSETERRYQEAQQRKMQAKQDEAQQRKMQAKQGEEQQFSHFAALRESYMKMLVSRFNWFASNANLWKQAQALAEQDYFARVEDMQLLYKELGSEPMSIPLCYRMLKERNGVEFNQYNTPRLLTQLANDAKAEH